LPHLLQIVEITQAGFFTVSVLALSSKSCVLMTVFWDAAPCSLVEIALIVDVVSTSETSVNIYRTTRRINPEDSHLHTRRRENPQIL
jgi:hypothetical protein